MIASGNALARNILARGFVCKLKLWWANLK